MQDRRAFVRTAALRTSALLLAPSLQGLISCASSTPGRIISVRHAALGEGGYGPLQPAGPELALPEGFRYSVVSVAGQLMSDGHATPNALDGMAAFPLANGNIRLIRNHENRDLPATARVKGDPSKAYDPKAGGGVTSLELHVGADGSVRVVRDFMSLNGTIINCAGGPTPWGTWLTCEESAEGVASGWGKEHGYIFEIPVSAEDEVDAVPLTAMGRFVHEAVAVDPRTNVVYETEDRLIAGFYRFIPDSPPILAAGGRLQMLAVSGRPNYDAMDGQRVGQRLPAEWVNIDEPNRRVAWDDTSTVFEQGFTKGGARFRRLEGCWYGDGSIYFNSTNGGDARCGQVWQYRPVTDTAGVLMLIFESPSREVLDGPDNITVSPRGGIVLCEDGEGEEYLRGITRDGRIFDFAKNLLNSDEFAGACFSPDGSILFVNVMGSTVDSGTSLGKTFAITGPWSRGAL